MHRSPHRRNCSSQRSFLTHLSFLHGQVFVHLPLYHPHPAPNAKHFEYLAKPRRPTRHRHKSEHLPFHDLAAKYRLPPSSPQAASAPEPRIGRPTTSNKRLEKKADLDPEMRRELERKIVEVQHTDAFIQAFLYMSDASRMEEDKKGAAKCLSTLQDDDDSALPDPSLAGDWENAPKHKDGVFGQIKELTSESRGYDLYVKLLNYAGAYFRKTIKGSDADWPLAQEPGSDDTTPTTSTHLLRIFRDTHTLRRAYSRNPKDRAFLSPDLCMDSTTKRKPLHIGRTFWCPSNSR